MKDALLKFGDISAATKATVAYSANILDMGKTTKTGNGDQVNVIFEAATAMDSADTVACQLYECDTVNGTFVLCAQGVAVCLDAHGKYALPVPRTHKRFLKAGVLPASSGTFTATTIKADIQLGA